MPLEIQVEIRDEKLKKLIDETGRKLKDLRPPLMRSGVHMVASMDKNFKREGRPQKWKPLRPNTVAGRRKGSSRILQDTGMLRMSVLSRVGKGNIYRLTPRSLTMGSNLKIAAWHQYGTPPYIIRPKTKKVLRFMTTSGWRFATIVRHPGLPARPFVLFQPEDEKAITEIFADYAVEN